MSPDSPRFLVLAAFLLMVSQLPVGVRAQPGVVGFDDFVAPSSPPLRRDAVVEDSNEESPQQSVDSEFLTIQIVRQDTSHPRWDAFISRFVRYGLEDAATRVTLTQSNTSIVGHQIDSKTIILEPVFNSSGIWSQLQASAADGRELVLTGGDDVLLSSLTDPKHWNSSSYVTLLSMTEDSADSAAILEGNDQINIFPLRPHRLSVDISDLLVRDRARIRHEGLTYFHAFILMEDQLLQPWFDAAGDFPIPALGFGESELVSFSFRRKELHGWVRWNLTELVDILGDPELWSGATSQIPVEIVSSR